MTNFGDYDVPLQGVETQLIEWVEEAYEARYGDYGDEDGPIGLPHYELGYGAFTSSLYRVRARLDRIGQLQAKVTRAKGRTSRAHKRAKEISDEAYAKATKQNKSMFFGSYATGDEKRSEAMLDDSVMQARSDMYKLERLLSVADEANTVIKNIYWDLNNLREEHVAFLRTLQFESSLER